MSLDIGTLTNFGTLTWMPSPVVTARCFKDDIKFLMSRENVSCNFAKSKIYFEI